MPKQASVIDKTPLGQRAAEIIRTRIVTGEYSLGSRLIEEELATEFNISRACIRDAFLMLESDGMVVRERNKSTRVFDFNKEKIINLFCFRRAIEQLCVETCAVNKTIPRQGILDKISKLMELREVDEIDSLSFVKTDLALHEEFVVASKNTYAIYVWEGLKYQLLTLLFTMYKKNKMEFTFRGIGEHEDILNLLEQGNIDEAVSRLRNHIDANLQFIIQNID